MKAAVWRGAGIEHFNVEEIQEPEMSPNEVLVKVKACHFGATSRRAILKGHARWKPPKILGRCIAGDIADIGKNVKTDNLAVGTRVTVTPDGVCGKCFYCKMGEPYHCTDRVGFRPGGEAEYVVVPQRLVSNIYEIPDGLSYAEGAYTEMLATCLNGNERANIKKGDTVAIIGAGQIGMNHAQLAKISGATEIISIDLFDERLKLVGELAATYTINVKEQDPVAEVRRLTDGFGADVVIEAVGSAPTYRQTFDLVRKGGTIVGFGGCQPGLEITIDPNVFHYPATKIVGSSGYREEHFIRALKVLARRSINIKPYLKHFVPLERVKEAVDLVANPDVVSVVITM